MADKFAITAELQLVLSANVQTQINELKKTAAASNVAIPVVIDDGSLKRFYKEVNHIFDSAKGSKRELGIKVGLDQASLKKFYSKDLNNIFVTAASSKRRVPLKVGIDNGSVKEFYKEVGVIFDTASKSKRRVGIKIGLDNAALKLFYSELNHVVMTANGSNKSIGLKIAFQKDKNFDTILQVINNLRSKSINFGITISKNAVSNIATLQSSLAGINTQIQSLDTTKLAGLLTGLTGLSKVSSTLARISGRKIAFDLSIKDAKAGDRLASILERVDAAFIKANQSASRFNSSIASLTNLVNLLGQAFKNLDFKNLNSVSKQIKNIGKSGAKNLQGLTNNTKKSTNAIYELGVQSAITLQKFGAYTLVTAGFFRLSFAIRDALGQFVEFNKELTKVRQVTKGSIGQTKELADEVTRLATQYGVSSEALLDTSLVLGQAGFTIADTKTLLEGLAKTELAATFEGLGDTTEGLIAAMAQFNFEADEMESKFSAINSVSAAFAVESSDITTAIQKTGGAFAAAGGNLEELIALFTSVRATTRESADTIATGLRTIFTRFQRVRTGKFLEDLGINIRATAEDVEKLGRTKPGIKVGDFVGPFEAIRRLALETSQLSSADPRFAQIVEELGGFRQINKVIPLLQQFGTAQNAINVALTGQESLTKDAIIAQESYANQIQQVKEEFLSLVRAFAEDQEVKTFIFTLLELAKAGLSVASSFEKIIVPLTAISGLFGASFIGKFLPGFTSKFGGGGKTRTFSNFNTGGLIPGRGPNKDTEIIKATKGEFVVRRQIVDREGDNALTALNTGFGTIVPRFNSGGKVGQPRGFVGGGLINKTNAGLALGGGLLLQEAFNEDGLISKFNDLEGNSKALAVGFVGLAAQLLVIKSATDGLSESFKNLTKTANKRFGKTTDRGLNRDPVDGLNQRFFNAKRNADSLQAKNVNATKIAKESRREIRDLRKERGAIDVELNKVRSAITQSSKSVSRNVIPNQRALQLADAAAVQRASRENITSEAVDPRSSAGKRGITRQFKIRDDKTGVFRNFDTEQQAQEFGSKRNQKFQQTRVAVREEEKRRIARDNLPFIQRQKRLRDRRRALEAGRSNLEGREFVASNTLGQQEARLEQIRRAESERQRTRELRKRRIRNRKLFRATTKNTALAGGIGLATTAVGSFAGDSLQTFGAPTDKQSGSAGLFAAGGALKGATQGGSLGAFIGSAFGPVGTAIGGAVGGIAGGARGAILALDEFEQQVLRVSSAESLGKLNDIFKNIDAGKTTATTGRVGVLSNLRNLRQNLRSTSDTETRQEIIGGIENSAVSFQKFFDGIASSSKSLRDFSTKVDDETLRFFTSVLGLNFKDFKSNIQDSIKVTLKLAKAERDLLSSIDNFDLLIKASVAFSRSFENAANQVDLFGQNLKSFAFGGLGSNQRNDELTSRLSNLSNINNVGELQGIITKFGANFGKEGRALSRQVNDAVKAANILPDVLLSLRSGSQLASEGDLEFRFEELLKDAGIGSEIGSLLVNRLSDLLGQEFKDSNFFAALNKDFPKALSDIIAGLDQPIQSFSKAYEVANQQLNEFASELNGIVQLNQQISAGILKQFDNRQTLIRSRETFSGDDLTNNSVRTEQSRTSFATGGRTGDQLFRDINSARQNIQNLDAQRQATEDPAKQGELTIKIAEQARFLDRANSGLKFLAQSTSELSAVQQKLNKEQQKRVSKKDVALDFVFGQQSDRTRLLRTQDFANTAAVTGSVQNIPQGFLSDVRSYLQRLSTSEIGNTGRTGQDVLDNLVRGAGPLGADFARSGKPGKQEAAIQSQIEALIGRQAEAQNKLNQILINDRSAFFNSLDSKFGSFLSDLSTNLQREEKQRLSFERDNVVNKLFGNEVKKKDGSIVRENGLIEQKNIITNISRRFGENAIANVADIQQVSQKSNEAGNIIAQTVDIPQKIQSAFAELNKLRTNSFAAGDSRIKIEDFNRVIGGLVANLPKNIIDDIRSKISTNISVDSNRTIGRSEAQPFITDLLSNIRKEAIGNATSLKIEEENITRSVGGSENYSKILANADEIIAKTQNLPESVDFKVLIKEVNTLSSKLQGLNQRLGTQPQPRSRPQPPIRRNTGGSVPGIGNVDSVPSLLTPGEFVLNKDAVRNIGIGNLFRMNRFANGGLVRPFRIKEPEKKGRFVGRISSDELKTYDKSNIPRTILSVLSKYGVNVDVADKVTDVDQSLRFQEPRGYPGGSYDNVKGLYRDSEKRILIRNDSGRDVLTHELGHAFDYARGGLSDHKLFIAAYRRDVSNLDQAQRERFKYFIQKGVAGRRESFAGIFDSVLRNTSSYASSFPESTKLVQGAIKKAEIDNLRNDFLALRRESFSKDVNYSSLLKKVFKTQQKIATSRVKDDSRVMAFSDILENAAKYYSNKILKRNSGGPIPGVGNTDSVHAFLTPGEFVMSKPAVQKHGIDKLSAMNKGRGVQNFADGGMVNGGGGIINNESITKFNMAIDQLSINIEKMKQAIATIPTEIVMHGTHRLDVYINGAQVFNQLKPELSNLVMGEIKIGINKLLRNKFPELGSFDG